MKEEISFFFCPNLGYFLLKEGFKLKKSVLKLTALSILAAIGVVLMSVVRIPYPVPVLNLYLNIEISDFVVIFAFVVFGFKEAALVAVLKTICDFMIHPVSGGIPFVAHGIALFASMMYVFAYWLASKIICKGGIGRLVAKYSLLVVFVSIFMTLANYIVFYPLFVGEGFKFFGIGLSPGARGLVETFSLGTNYYIIGICVMFFPFNLLKASIIAIVAATTGDTLMTIYRNKFKLKDKRYEEIT